MKILTTTATMTQFSGKALEKYATARIHGFNINSVEAASRAYTCLGKKITFKTQYNFSRRSSCLECSCIMCVNSDTCWDYARSTFSIFFVTSFTISQILLQKSKTAKFTYVFGDCIIKSFLNAFQTSCICV